MTTEELNNGEYLMELGEASDFVYLVLNGRGSLQIENGRYGAMDDLIQPGSVVGTIEAVREEVAISSIKVMSSKMKVAKWPRDEFMMLVKSDHRVRTSLHIHTQARLGKLTSPGNPIHRRIAILSSHSFGSLLPPVCSLSTTSTSYLLST